MKWNERSREEQKAIEQSIFATVREADAKVQTVPGARRPARKAA
jgi:hypothetical protein